MTAQINRAIKNSVLTYRSIQWELVPVGKKKSRKYYLVSDRSNNFYYYLDDTGEIIATHMWCPNQSTWVQGCRIAFTEKQVKVLIKSLLQREGRYWTFKDHLNLLKAKIRYRILHR